MKVLYHYILSPIHTMRLYRDQLGWGPVIGVLLLLSFGSVSTFSVFLSMQLVFGAFGWAFLMVMQSVLTDVVAQAMGFPGRAIPLFKWMVLAHLPFVLLPAAKTVLGVGPIVVFGGLVSIVICVLVWVLQVRTIQTQYVMSLRRAILTFFGPILATMGIAVVLAMLVMMSMV